ncbi:MAG: hypothetical protein A2V88_01955 [Elusimicrobia bacterium RBG_16_66_12]|nr:MAG: hypothetical protein A2V88_01955 [Elusimicrobia bacterium RBG_16_66_12]
MRRIEEPMKEFEPDCCAKGAPKGGQRCVLDFKRWADSLGIPLKSAERLSDCWRPGRYIPGNVIFYQGHQPLGIYFVRTGSVKLVRAEGTGRQRIIRVIQAPSVLGERSLIADLPYAAAGIALEDSCVCFIETARFQKLWDADPALSRFFARLLASKLGDADEAGTDLALRTIRERVAKFIITLEGASKAPGAAVSLGMSRQELAEFMGTSPEAICRTFSELAAKGLISTQGRLVRILDRARLHAAAGLTFINRSAAVCHRRLPGA